MNALNKNIHIKNGHVIDPANGIDGLNDLYIADGKVLAVGAAPAGFTPTKPSTPSA
jgi:dihydroorotase